MRARRGRPGGRRRSAIGAGVVALLLAVGVGGCGSGADPSSAGREPGAETGPTVGSFARLDPDAFADRMGDGEAVVINVHIPYEGEIERTDAFIPFDAIVGDSRLPTDQDRELLLYCRSGRMSEISSQALLAAGYTNVSHLEGGMKAWKASGRPLTDDPAHAGDGG